MSNVLVKRKSRLVVACVDEYCTGRRQIFVQQTHQLCVALVFVYVLSCEDWRGLWSVTGGGGLTMQWLWTCALLVALTDTGNGLARNNLGKYLQWFFSYCLTAVRLFVDLPIFLQYWEWSSGYRLRDKPAEKASLWMGRVADEPVTRG